MTAKRFTIKHYESQDWAYDNNKPIHTKEMVELLNELHKENKQLHNENKTLKKRVMIFQDKIRGLMK